MSANKIGEVTTPTNATFYVFWDQSSGEVTVGNESAGQASNQAEAMKKANYYATTRKIMN